MKIHPLCLLLPWMSETELQELADDIQQNGQREPILLLRGEVIDGKNRVRACEKLGIKVKSRDVDESNPAAMVRSYGVFRRHLTTSQRSMLAAELTGHAAGRPSKSGSVDPDSIRKKVAKRLAVSEPQLKRANKVRKHAVKPIQQQVVNGALSVSAAATVATLPKLEQRALAEAGPEAVRDKAAEMRAPWPAGSPPETKQVNGETKRPVASQERAERETKPAGNETVAVILKHLDKWWASEKRNLCSYPPAAPQRIWDLVRAEIVKVGA